MVEFETLESASKARTSLHGCDIYNNCCTMKVEYSKMESLKVRENGPMSWDFTLNSNEGRGEMGRPVILNDPDMAMGGGGHPDMMGGGRPDAFRGQEFMSGMRSMDMMGPGHVRQGDDRSCVVIVHNLAMGEINCDRHGLKIYGWCIPAIALAINAKTLQFFSIFLNRPSHVDC